MKQRSDHGSVDCGWLILSCLGNHWERHMLKLSFSKIYSSEASAICEHSYDKNNECRSACSFIRIKLSSILLYLSTPIGKEG